MIDSIQIKNIRSLKDTNEIPLKRLNVLVGSNSSGKSTFLRTFLLLSQSTTKSLRNAIAWFDETLVDFGDFVTTKTKGIDEDKITISLRLPDRSMDTVLRKYYWSLNVIRDNLFSGCKVDIDISYISENRRDYISAVILTFKNGIKVEINFEYKSHGVKIKIGDIEYKYDNAEWRNASSNFFLPDLFMKIDNSGNTIFSDYRQKQVDQILQTLVTLRKYCNKASTHYEKLLEYMGAWNIDKKKCLEEFKKINVFANLKKKISSWTVDSEEFVDIYNKILGILVIYNWDTLSLYIAKSFASCEYIAPIRAEASRYYRNVGMQVERVDSYGRNLAEFIDSFTTAQKQSFDVFVKDILRMKVMVKNNMGHQSIVITPDVDDDVERTVSNLIDTGFGYSQILPIITKLWWISERTRFRKSSLTRHSATVLIEQPELHLHPSLQAKLADAFIKVSISDKARTNIILETHSPTIINRIGRRVREGYINPEDINIILFNKNLGEEFSTVKTTSFDKDGRIEEWPYGFFEPKDDAF